MLKRTIRKVHMAIWGDPNSPKAEVEVYCRDTNGQTFHVPTLYEGILHLLSNEGYRLSVWEWPDGAAVGNERFGITVRRGNKDLVVELAADCLAFTQRGNEVKYDLKRPDKKLPNSELGSFEVVYLDDETEPNPCYEDLAEIVIDGR